MIDRSGGQPDPEKISAIQAMKPPTNISEMRRFLGRGLPAEEVLTKLADLTQLLCVLLIKTAPGSAQEQPFAQVYEEFSKPTTLVLYDPQTKSEVSADPQMDQEQFCYRTGG